MSKCDLRVVSLNTLIFCQLNFPSILEKHSFNLSIRQYHLSLSFYHSILKHSFIYLILQCQPSKTVLNVALKRAFIDHPLTYLRQLSLLLLAFIECSLVDLFVFHEFAISRL